MGADLIGYFVTIPDDENQCYGVFMRHMESLRDGLKKHAALKKRKKSKKLVEKSLFELREVGVDVDLYLHDADDGIDAAIQKIEDDMGYVADNTTPYGGIPSFRDSARMRQSKKVSVYFAGELSWGDEPTGGGYLLLKKLCDLGFDSAFSLFLEKKGYLK